MYQRRSEMDRPTRNSLLYLTKVKPHFIRRESDVVDPYVRSSLEELMGTDTVAAFGEYTRSFYSLEGHYYNLWLYDRPIVSKPNDPVLDEAIRHTSSCFKLGKPVDAISWHSLKSVPFIPTSSAGYGYVGKKGDPGNHSTAIRRANMSLRWWSENQQGLNTPFRYAPDLAWSRTQLGTYINPKIRHIWGTAFQNIILEGMTAAPLIQAYQQVGEPIVLGMHMYKKLPDVISQALKQDDTFNFGVGLDFKSFDTSIQPWMIKEAFNIVRQNVTFNDEFEKLSLDYTEEYFIRKPVVMPDGRMWLKQIGIPSGSYYTGIIGSICNHIAITYAQLKVYNRTFQTWVLGDDSLFGVPYDLEYPDPSLFSPHLTTLGLTLSEGKCVIATRPDDLTFLGHAAHNACVTRDVAELMRIALYPEFPVSGPSHSLSRIKGLLLDSGLTSWPVVHLHDYMCAKWRYEPIDFLNSEGFFKNWVRVISNVPSKMSEVDVVRAWTIT